MTHPASSVPRDSCGPSLGEPCLSKGEEQAEAPHLSAFTSRCTGLVSVGLRASPYNGGDTQEQKATRRAEDSRVEGGRPGPGGHAELLT